MGAILYEMATGRQAFSATSTPAVLYRICYGACEPLKPHRPEAPPAFVEIIERTLSRDPSIRILEVDDLRLRLRQALAAVATEAYRFDITTPGEPRPRGATASLAAPELSREPAHKQWSLWAVAGGVLVLAAAMAFLVSRPTSAPPKAAEPAQVIVPLSPPPASEPPMVAPPERTPPPRASAEPKRKRSPKRTSPKLEPPPRSRPAEPAPKPQSKSTPLLDP